MTRANQSPEPPPPTVYLIDDDASFLRATSRMLRASGYTVAAYGSAEEFFRQHGEDAAGCVVTDLAMPGIDGLALQERLGEGGCPLPVIFLSARGDIPTTVRAMRGGAEDFLTKDAPREELLGAIERATARDAQERARRARFRSLTPREVQVLRHVVEGMLNKQIAAELGIHERTVKLHRTSITAKLGVRSAAQLAVLARDAGLFDGPSGRGE